VAPLARLEHVTYTYPGRQSPALTDVTLEFSPAEVVLVLGGSGSGKSTLLRALNGLVPHFHGGTFAGRVVVAGRDTRSTKPQDLAGLVGLVFQDPENQAVMTSVEREIAFGLENLGMQDAAITRLVEESLISLGLSRLRRAELSTLSGGELQKVALAAVIAMQPQVLLLDEPTSQLDPVSSEELLSAVRRLAEDTGATILLAEHRVERCLHLATRVVYLQDGAVAADAEPQAFARWAVRGHRELLPPVTRLFARRLNGQAADVPAGGLPMTVKDARRLLESAAWPHPTATWAATPVAGAGRAPGRRRSAEPTPVIEVRGLSAGYPPDEPVLEDVDLTLGRGEFMALMGENGAGKSTLVRHFNGLARPLAGSVRLLGREVTAMSVAEAARHCAFLGQNPNAYFVRDTVAEEIDFTLEHLGFSGAERARLAAAAAEELDLLDLLGRNPRDLSGGERTRVALAAVACGEPAAVVLDEPTRGMDPQHKVTLSELLRRWAADGRCIVVVTHDVEFAARCADRVVVLGDGGVLADGDVHEVLHGSLFFSTQVNRLFRHTLPGVLHENELGWEASPR
jgi:energy-coupling factor transporter ATP-binding protein EcfA2